MKILTRNVNGIRAVAKKGFIEAIQTLDPDVICLQETKAFFAQCPQEIIDMGYHICRHTGTRPGYAGTAIFTKIEPDHAVATFPHICFHEDGRLTEVQFGDTVIINGYFPNGGVRADGTEMLGYKLEFYNTLMAYLATKKDKKLIIVGDYNICHTEIDIARPKENLNSIGFLPVERKKVTEFLEEGYIDTFRYLYPEQTGAYTWRSYRAGAKQNNVGRRIDYACVSSNLEQYIVDCTHYPEITGSDHCPVMLELNI